MNELLLQVLVGFLGVVVTIAAPYFWRKLEQLTKDNEIAYALVAISNEKMGILYKEMYEELKEAASDGVITKAEKETLSARLKEKSQELKMDLIDELMPLAYERMVDALLGKLKEKAQKPLKFPVTL